VVQVVAKYEGLDLEIVTIDPSNKPADFLAKFPQGLVSTNTLL
jgi:glutathione S-transferase